MADFEMTIGAWRFSLANFQDMLLNGATTNKQNLPLISLI